MEMGNPPHGGLGGGGGSVTRLCVNVQGPAAPLCLPNSLVPKQESKSRTANLLPLSPVSSDEGVTQGQKGNSPYMWNALATALEEKVHHLRAQVSLSAPKIVPRVLYMPGRPPTTELYSRPRRLLLRNVC